ncbi:restriction endonuclease subunit S [uncultured Limosilactobacillus sp.]|uniref:restriction endonuclease subunit S n=1 Tax=uncultured Limosilactobacillus sp. TaxID=2837629 RepID=UPI0025D8B917|nr:restriction endonuclease subunit S [uncultured Limosilactobacillus sp.]
MKDSGIAWIDQIPENWKTVKIKYCLSRNEKKNHPNATVLSVYRDYGVVPKNSRDDNHNVTSSDTSNYKYVVKGNLVINKMKAWQGSLAVSRYTGIVSPAYYVYQFTNSKLNKAYFHYLIRNCYKDEFRRLSTGIRDGQWDLQAYDFENTLILLPSQLEQQQIADFLDSKTAEIDGLIDKINTEIEKLQQYQSNVIFQAITKGLNQSVLMKDSGVEWIGEIPETWKMIRLKYLVDSVVTGDWGEDKIDDYKKSFMKNMICLRVTDFAFNRGTFKSTPPKLLTYRLYTLTTIKKLILHEGDILIEKSGGGEKTPVGRAVIFDKKYKALYANFLSRIRLKKGVSSKFVEYFLRSLYHRGVTKLYFNQTTGIQNLKLDELLSTEKMALPKLNEQHQITDYLEQKVAQIQRLIKLKKQQINQLTEYKSSLIFEYVTGKKQVNEAN